MTIDVQLSPASIGNVITLLKEYKRKIEKGAKNSVNELADIGVSTASTNFANAEYAGDMSVKVDKRKNGKNGATVYADGKGVLFMEFGTGVVFASPVHPEADALGMIRGEYGDKHGRSPKGWFYHGLPGTLGEKPYNEDIAARGLIHTFGNPANMCMYKAVREVEDRCEEVVERCFK